MKSYPVSKPPKNDEWIVLCWGIDIYVGFVKIDLDDGVKVFVCDQLEDRVKEWRKLDRSCRWCYERELVAKMGAAK